MKRPRFSFFFGLVAVWGLSGVAPVNAAAPAEGQFHLVYRVIAPKVEVGAEVAVEPAFLTDGNRIVFAWNYCRHHYPAKNYRADYGIQEERVDRKGVPAADQVDLEHYCQKEPFALKGSGFSVLDNAGVRLALDDASFVPAHIDGDGANRRAIPERFAAVISEIKGTVPPKLVPALEDQQPYVFLASRNLALLERLVLVTKTPAPVESAALLARLEQYKAKRLASDPIGAKEQCGIYLPNFPSRDGWMGATNIPPAIAEVFHFDFDGDERVDMFVRLVEKPKLNGMARIYYGDGKEQCVFRNRDGNRNSPIYHPLALLKTNSCVYAFTQTSTYENPNMNLIPLAGSSKTCRAAEAYRFHERH